MEITPKSLEDVKTKSGYSIIACNTPDELSQQVSAALEGGVMFLHGHPFVFKDQICQAIKFLTHG